jgi:hypothetical protein
MTGSTVLISTWSDGLFVIEGGKVRQELAGRGVRGLAAGDDESVLAIVDTGKLCRRGREGAWAQLAESQSPLSCCLISRGKVFVGTDDGAEQRRLQTRDYRLFDIQHAVLPTKLPLAAFYRELLYQDSLCATCPQLDVRSCTSLI